jgi:PqqD family protein of HPr-rel-A system
MALPTGALWRLCRPEQLHWACWDSEFSLFDEQTGETHLINALPAEVIRELEQGPLDLPTLSARLAQLCEAEDTPEWRVRISGVLTLLQSLELLDANGP